MKKNELISKFNAFYKETYPSAMRYCMVKTGDFVNSEDLLADTYYAIYKSFLKDKNGELRSPEDYLFKVLKNRIAQYWKKQRITEPLPEAGDEYEALLQTELNLTEEQAMKQMLLQDILEFVSEQPPLMRRAFTMHFYFDMSIEETANELEVSVAAARNYIYRLLCKVKENYLEKYE